MSSILKALKKLEKDSPNVSDGGTSASREMKTAIGKRSRDHWLWYKRLSILFGMIVLFMGAGLVYSVYMYHTERLAGTAPGESTSQTDGDESRIHPPADKRSETVAETEGRLPTKPLAIRRSAEHTSRPTESSTDQEVKKGSYHSLNGNTIDFEVRVPADASETNRRQTGGDSVTMASSDPRQSFIDESEKMMPRALDASTMEEEASSMAEEMNPEESSDEWDEGFDEWERQNDLTEEAAPETESTASLQTETVPESVSPSEMETVPEMVQDSRFSFQALVWSGVPEERMVVINDRIYHEGDEMEDMDDITIVTIGETYVTFRENGIPWTLPFLLK